MFGEDQQPFLLTEPLRTQKHGEESESEVAGHGRGGHRGRSTCTRGHTMASTAQNSSHEEREE